MLAQGVGVLIVMHGRSRMTVDPRIPTKRRDGARRVFADQAGVSRPEISSVSRGKGELHPTKKPLCEACFGTLRVLPCTWMTASNDLIFFL